MLELVGKYVGKPCSFGSSQNMLESVNFQRTEGLRRNACRQFRIWQLRPPNTVARTDVMLCVDNKQPLFVWGRVFGCIWYTISLKTWIRQLLDDPYTIVDVSILYHGNITPKHDKQLSGWWSESIPRQDPRPKHKKNNAYLKPPSERIGCILIISHVW